MKLKGNDKLGESYKAQDKAPKKGVKANDCDEYKASGAEFKNLHVQSHKAYANQAKAPTGRGSSGPTQAHGNPNAEWNKSVSKHKAYDAQCKAQKEGTESPSMGFKAGKGFEYLGHFAQDKFLKQGHNDGPDMDAGYSSGSAYNQDKDAAKSFVKGFNGQDSKPIDDSKSRADQYEKIRQQNKKNFGG